MSTPTYPKLLSNDTIINEILQNGEMIDLKKNVDDVFLILNGIIVSIMQPGFACLEAGSIQSKSVTNIFFKNVLDLFVCCFWYWLIGYSLSYSSGNAFWGLHWWAGIGLPGSAIPHWFFQFIFAATAATILSGAVAERCNPITYFAYSSIISGFVYPVVAHWVWTSEGWLSKFGYEDFSGAGVVHALAGTSSFFAALIIGPRKNRFSKTADIILAGHSVPLIGTGTLLLIVGFLSFNGGSLGHMTNPGDGEIIAKVICNTIMGGTGGSAIVLICAQIGLFGRRYWPFSITVNAMLTGMVSVCGSPDSYSMLESLIIGAIGAIIYLALHYFLLFCEIDDPLDASPVHFGGGFWGAIAAGIFKKNGIIKNSNFKNGAKKLVINIIGVVAIVLWSALSSIILFLFLKYAGVLRITEEEETEGLDKTIHEEEAYSVMMKSQNGSIKLGENFTRHDEQRYHNSAYDNATLELNEYRGQQL